MGFRSLAPLQFAPLDCRDIDDLTQTLNAR